MKRYHSPEKDKEGDQTKRRDIGSPIEVSPWSDLVDSITHLFKEVNGLVSSSSSAVDSFVEMSSSSAISRSRLRDTTELIFELLDSNAKLTLQLKRLSGEVKMELESREYGNSPGLNISDPDSELRSNRYVSSSKVSSPQSRTRPDVSIQKTKPPEADPSSRDSAGSTSSRNKRYINGESRNYDSESDKFVKIYPTNTKAHSSLDTSLGRQQHNFVRADSSSKRAHLSVQKERQNYDSEPETFSLIHPEADGHSSLNVPSVSRQSSAASQSAQIAPINHAYIPSRRGLQKEVYDSEPEEIHKVYFAVSMTCC